MNEDSSKPPSRLMTQPVVIEAPEWVRRANETHRADLLRYAYSVCRDEALAQDAVQETYLRLMREDPARLDGHLAPWLFRVCRSRVIDAQRKDRRLTPLETETSIPMADPEAENPAVQAEATDTQSMVWEAVGTLTAIQQEVMRLKFQAQLSYKEISEVTGKSVNAVGVHLHTALSLLRDHFSKHPEW